jgi:hypothetical protein
MKRRLLLLAVLVLVIVLAWLVHYWWHPLLESRSAELELLEALVSMAAILGGGVAAFVKLRGKAPADDAVSRAGRDFPPELPRDPAYEPTPILDTAPPLDEDDSPYLGLSAFHNDHKAADTAFLLVIDQFEELFTFSNREERRHLDRQLAHSLQDGDCPLYLINTVRIDYLEGFEQLPGPPSSTTAAADAICSKPFPGRACARPSSARPSGPGST